MDMLTRDAFRRLAEREGPFCLTLLMPTHRAGRETKQDPIRFKNLLRDAESALVRAGARASDAREQLGALARLHEDSAFWSQQDLGLAAFCAPDSTELFSVSQPLAERVVVDRRYHLLPLAAWINEDVRFYVLALSAKRVRLWEASRRATREVALPEGPESVEDLDQCVQAEKQLQFHTGSSAYGASGRRAAMFHGQPGGESASEQKLRLLEFARLVDHRVQKVMGDDDAPLVLACDDRLASIYRETNALANLAEASVSGNPDERSAGALADDARTLLRPRFAAERRAAIAALKQAASLGKAALELDTVLAAAEEGRIDTLLVAADAMCWGRFDHDTREVHVHEEPKPGDEELLNLATLIACRSGAALSAMSRDEMPEHRRAAAVLRY